MNQNLLFKEGFEWMMISLAKRMSRFEGGESMRKTNCVSKMPALGTGYTGECGKSKSLSPAGHPGC